MKLMELYKEKIMGAIRGLDRIRFRGTLRWLANESGMRTFLSSRHILLKDFKQWAEGFTCALRKSCDRCAEQLGIPIQYIRSGSTDKEKLARRIAEQRGAATGPICLLSVVEQCISPTVKGNRSTKKLELKMVPRKCVWLYHYFNHPEFGFGHVRLQSWLPFNIFICLNGRHWLERQLLNHHIAYVKDGNCFPWIEDIEAAQALINKQLETNWSDMLNGLVHDMCPDLNSILPLHPDYYWSADETEWATDILFKSASSLAKIYSPLVRGAISAFSSVDVMRFLGKKPNGNFRGEIVSSYKKRPEGIRVKHYCKANSVKIYDKQGSILRIETTINEPRDFKVYRPKDGQPDGPCDWRRMRKGIADLHRRARVSDASNKRYLDALASLNTNAPLRKLFEAVCKRKKWKGHMVRALRPWSFDDRILLETISRGEFTLNGFRNRDIVGLIFDKKFSSLEEKRRASVKITRSLRLLRAHGIIRRLPHTNRYVFTKKGRQITTAIIEMQAVTLEQLRKAAA